MKKGASFLSAFKITILLILISCIGLFESHADQVDDIRNTLKEWVSVEKTISEEQENWRQEKQLLESVLLSLNQEERVLNNSITEAEQLSTRADNERLELISRRDIFQSNTDQFREQLVLFERQAIQLIPRLPNILREELGLMINRLYLSETSSNSLSERAQNLITILTEIQKFDSSITVSNELRSLNTEEKIEVKVLYLGLSTAFYVDKNNRIAGIGHSAAGGSEEGWHWNEQNDLADEIKNAIHIFENNDAPALIQLPLNIQSN